VGHRRRQDALLHAFDRLPSRRHQPPRHAANDFQFPILGQNGLTEIKNANQARIMGFEADMLWQPTSRLSFSGAMSYIDAKLTANYCGYVDAAGEPETGCPFPVDDPMTPQNETDPPEAPEGSRLPVVPKFKGTFTARYEFPLGAVDAHLQGSVSGQTQSESELLAFDKAILGPHTGFVTADFSAGVARDNWEIVAYITNAFDERADLFNFVACPIGTCADRVYQGTNQPRTIGVRFSSRFGRNEE
jgi:outer membrane receptor protein involved in Fe transport